MASKLDLLVMDIGYWILYTCFHDIWLVTVHSELVFGPQKSRLWVSRVHYYSENKGACIIWEFVNGPKLCLGM